MNKNVLLVSLFAGLLGLNGFANATEDNLQSGSDPVVSDSNEVLAPKDSDAKDKILPPISEEEEVKDEIKDEVKDEARADVVASDAEVTPSEDEVKKAEDEVTPDANEVKPEVKEPAEEEIPAPSM